MQLDLISSISITTHKEHSHFWHHQNVVRSGLLGRRDQPKLLRVLLVFCTTHEGEHKPREVKLETCRWSPSVTWVCLQSTLLFPIWRRWLGFSIRTLQYKTPASSCLLHWWTFFLPKVKKVPAALSSLSEFVVLSLLNPWRRDYDRRDGFY